MTKAHNSYHTLLEIGSTTIFLNQINIKNIRMGRVQFNSALIDKLNSIKIKQREGQCVQDYIWEVVKGQPGLKRYNHQELIEEFNRYVIDVFKRPNTYDIVKWRYDCHPNISIYAIDPFYHRLGG